MSSTFTARVLAVVARIRRGHTMTYQQVAAAAGSKKAYRSVGNILNNNYDPSIPCHRVIRSDGSYGGYNRGSVRKQNLLLAEQTKNRKSSYGR